LKDGGWRFSNCDKKNWWEEFPNVKKTKIINFLMNNDYWEFIIGETRIYSPKNFYNIINSS
jgi:hypothetical protein